MGTQPGPLTVLGLAIVVVALMLTTGRFTRAPSVGSSDAELVFPVRSRG
jgi:hypothetical protein